MMSSGTSNKQEAKHLAAQLQRIEVSVFTADALYHGEITCKTNQRLLDALNSCVNPTASLSREYLEIRNVSVYAPGAAAPHRQLDVGYARRGSILCVVEHGCLEGCRMERSHPMRQKKAMRAEVELPHLLVRGSFFGETWQVDLPAALHRDEAFLPLTDVELNVDLASYGRKFGFAAVNREHVIFIGAEAQT